MSLMQIPRKIEYALRAMIHLADIAAPGALIVAQYLAGLRCQDLLQIASVPHARQHVAVAPFLEPDHPLGVGAVARLVEDRAGDDADGVGREDQPVPPAAGHGAHDRWRAWLQAHRDSLAWDPASGTFVARA